jgi:hypothetical protein
MSFQSYIQSNQKIIIGLVLLFLVGGTFYLYCKNKFHVFDTMANSSFNAAPYQSTSVSEPISAAADTNSPAMDPSELLPNNHDSQWTALNPINEKSMVVPDVLQSDFFIGINTVGSSKKNPNLQGREDPYIEKVDTSGQWNNNSNDMR